MRANKAALLTTFATTSSVSAGIDAVQSSSQVSEKISVVGTGRGESEFGTSDLPADNKDGIRSVLLRTEDGEEWSIEVKDNGEVMMKTEDGGEFPVLP